MAERVLVKPEGELQGAEGSASILALPSPQV